jgi:aminoglycoside phosphotransferase (APT) family kinase protein
MNTLASYIRAGYGDLLDVTTLNEIETTNGWSNENYYVSSHDRTRRFILRVNAPGVKNPDSLHFEYAILEKMRVRNNLTVVPKIIAPLTDTYVDVPEHGLCVLFELCEGEHKSVIDATKNEAKDIIIQVASFLGTLHIIDFHDVNIPSDRKNDVEGALGDSVIIKQRKLLREHFGDSRLVQKMTENETLHDVVTELVRLHGVFFPENADGTFKALTVPMSLVHNDFHYDNVLFMKRDAHWRLSAALDWELSFIGPSIIDYALGLYFWCSCPVDNSFGINEEYARIFRTAYEEARASPLTQNEKDLIKRAMLVSIYWSIEFVTNPREDVMRKDLQAIKYDLCLVYLQRYLAVLSQLAKLTDQEFIESFL